MHAAARTAGFWLLFPAFGLALYVSPCLADAYLVEPVSLNLSVETPQGLFRLNSRDTQPIRVQVDVAVWTQEQGANREEPTADFIVSPRFVDLPPGAGQVVRIALRHPAAQPAEQSYRVLFREVVESPGGIPGEKGIALDYSIPLFVAPAVPGGPHLEWALRRVDASTLLLAVSNTGVSHGKITLYSLVRKTGLGPVVPPIDLSKISGWQYILAGVTRTLRLRSSAPLSRGDNLLLTMELDGRRMELPFTLQ